MELLVRTNDMVMISFLQSLLKEAEIDHLVLDQNMSVLDGSIGAIPRRLMVPSDQLQEARSLLQEAGLEKELAELRK